MIGLSASVSIVHEKKNAGGSVLVCIHEKKYLRMTPYFLDNMMMMTMP